MSPLSAILIPAASLVAAYPTAHTHRWRIAEQGAARSAGRRRCGRERLFENGWEGDREIRVPRGRRPVGAELAMQR
jgi:hypothetical protein